MDFTTIASSTTSAISSVLTNITSLFTANIEVILSILGLTIGIPFVVKMFKRFAK